MNRCADSEECIWTRIIIGRVPFIIGCIYRLPNSDMDSFFENFEDMLLQVTAKSNKVLYLDGFNINMSNISSTYCNRFRCCSHVWNEPVC